jgi:O-succinylbenzoic acid--CoA ligase
MELIGLLSKHKGDPALQTISNDSAAIITYNSTLSYRQLNDNINSVAIYLSKSGISRGDNVAIISENSQEYVVVILALWKLGAVPVPLNLRLLPHELKELTSLAGCNLVLTGKLSEEIVGSQLSGENISCLSIKDIPIIKATAGKDLNSAGLIFDEPDKFILNNTALIIYTSGSSGKPKGVRLSFNNLFQSAYNGDRYFQQKKDDRWLASLPFYHIGGFSVFARNFFYGTTLIIPQSLKTEDLRYAIENQNPTLISLVTTQLKRLMDAGCIPNPQLRRVLLGGGFIDAELINEALGKGWNVSKSYGASETASFVTVLSPEEFKLKPGSAGKPIPPNQILILDDHYKQMPEGKVGQIAVSAQSVALGYLHDEDAQIKFSGNTFFSGDYGYLDKDGFLFVIARREDLIISGGEHIIPSEVETEILKYPGVKEVCVIGLEDKEWGYIPAAAIVSENEITIGELKNFLKDKMPSFKMPAKILMLDKLPKSELGKILRGKIKEKFNDLKNQNFKD